MGVMSGRGRKRRGQEGNPYPHHPPSTGPKARIHHSLRHRRNNMKFTGHERDPETGLDYMLARYYSAGGGRFLQVDLVDIALDFNNAKTKKEKQRVRQLLENPMVWNKYAYCHENPLTHIDPDGKWPVFIGIGVLAGAAWIYTVINNYHDAYRVKAPYLNAADKLWEKYTHAQENLTDHQGSMLEDIVSSRDQQAFKAGARGFVEIGLATPGTTFTGPVTAKVLELVANAIEQVVTALKSKKLSDKAREKLKQKKKDLEAAQLDLKIRALIKVQ